jgi:chorismate-pyruvate lyase
MVRHFDPLTVVATAQSAKPAALSAINLRVLSPLQRALLVIDGTVTKFLEAYVLEPIDIQQLAQNKRTLADSQEWLEAPPGTEILRRQVAIEGRYSHNLYVYAVSCVVLNRLPEKVVSSLELTGTGIGQVLYDNEIETRREILWFGREHAAEIPDTLKGRTNGEFISRTYRIIAGNRPVALINEKFPASMDRFPSHH